MFLKVSKVKGAIIKKQNTSEEYVMDIKIFSHILYYSNEHTPPRTNTTHPSRLLFSKNQSTTLLMYLFCIKHRHQIPLVFICKRHISVR